MVLAGLALATTRRARMIGHEDVLVKDLHTRVGTADPEPLGDEPMRRRIERVIKDDVAVGMELGLLPRGQRMIGNRSGFGGS